MAEDTDDTRGLPQFLRDVIKRYPEVWEKYRDLGKTLGALKGLKERDQAVVKLGVAIGSGHEGAVHSHVRRCREAGLSDDEIRHAVLLAVPAIGWPAAMAALSWAEDVI